MHADIGIGLIVAWTMCRLFGIEPGIIHALIGIVFALLPDLDTFGELFKKGKVAAHADNPHDHREGLHYPMALMVLSGAVMYLWLGSVFGIIAATSVFLHFAHDSVGTGWGIKWLWPFSRRIFKFFCEKTNKNSLNPIVSWTPQELSVAIRKYGDPNWLPKYLRSPFFVVEVLVLLMGLTLWIFFRKTP